MFLDKLKLRFFPASLKIFKIELGHYDKIIWIDE